MDLNKIKLVWPVIRVLSRSRRSQLSQELGVPARSNLSFRIVKEVQFYNGDKRKSLPMMLILLTLFLTKKTNKDSENQTTEMSLNQHDNKILFWHEWHKFLSIFCSNFQFKLARRHITVFESYAWVGCVAPNTSLVIVGISTVVPLEVHS